MKVALFIPCYVDQFYPHAGVAALELLEKLGMDVFYPLSQTCCGQPLANSGYQSMAGGVEKNFIESFANFDYIVGLSGSCVLHVKEHLNNKTAISDNIHEICEFIYRYTDYKSIKSSFPHKVGVHQGCHGLRGLRLSKASEVVTEPFSILDDLLAVVNGLELVKLRRPDECCGFGGTFSVNEEAVSVRMGEDRVSDFSTCGTEVLASTDMSCLMHLEGLIKRKKLDIKVKHIVEILNADK